MATELGHVYREHVTPIWRYVRARLPSDADAEDVTSEVFTRALRSWDAYDAARGPVGAWLTGIARFTVADWWRKHGREIALEAPEAEGSSDYGDPEGEALQRDGTDQIRRHLGRLTAREREAIALRFGSGLSSEEVGAILGVSASAARMLVHRGVARLREVMSDE